MKIVSEPEDSPVMAVARESYAAFDLSQALSIQWWLQHLADAYEENPIHMLTELCLVILIIYLVVVPSKPPKISQKLSAKEEQELIAEWEPEPLGNPMFSAPNNNHSNLNYMYDHSGNHNNNHNNHNNRNDMASNNVYISSAMSSTVSCNVNNGINNNENEMKMDEFIQFSSHNYLGFSNFQSIKEKCIETIKTYAVGSCGPRGFYGTMDIHLNLEKKLSQFFSSNNEKNNREAIIYADNIGCCASVITAFAKRGDLLLIDEGCHYLVTQGAILSRANVIWYPHNDMKRLESYLQTVQAEDERLNRPLNRRYIITEGLFHNHGDICDLQKICALKEEYKYRLILDDSHGLGVLHPKGSPGYWGIDMTRIDIYLSSMDTALGSTGGFCVGDHETIYHQTLSGAGYVFSASAPPFQCTAVIEALKILETENGVEYIQQLQDNAAKMRQYLEDKHGRWVLNGEAFSPLIHLRLSNNMIVNNDTINRNNNNNGNNKNNNGDNNGEMRVFELFENVCLMARQENILIFPSAYLPQEFGISEKSNPKASLRIVVTREHSDQQMKRAADVIKQLLSKALNDGRSETRK